MEENSSSVNRTGDDYSPLTDIPEGYHNHDYNKQSAE